jgi:hypothetical protein
LTAKAQIANHLPQQKKNKNRSRTVRKIDTEPDKRENKSTQTRQQRIVELPDS